VHRSFGCGSVIVGQPFLAARPTLVGPVGRKGGEPTEVGCRQNACPQSKNLGQRELSLDKAAWWELFTVFLPWCSSKEQSYKELP